MILDFRIFLPSRFLNWSTSNTFEKIVIAIDKLNFSFKFLEEDHTEIDKDPESGVYVYKLYLDGAKWDEASRTLTKQSYGVLYKNMPPILFEPLENYNQDPEEYACPIYKTSVRLVFFQ